MDRGFAYGPAYTLTPGTTIAWAGLPSCVIPSLAYYQPGSRAAPTAPEGATATVAVSETGFGMGVSPPVREYQPVVHRLRLSASP